MITLRQYSKDFDFSPYDYVFEDTQKFAATLPYLTTRLEGRWHLLLLTPKLPDVRTYLDVPLVPSHVDLVIALEPEQLEQVYLERPHLVEKAKSNWDVYLDLLKDFPVPMDKKAARELYYRVGPKEAELRGALRLLEDYNYISVKVINQHFAPTNRVFANQVVRAFLQRRFKYAWRLLASLEAELGTRVAFYAMRKNIRRVFQEKCKYMRNEETKDRVVEVVGGYDIITLYWLFETAQNPEQLYPILLLFERRLTPCLS